MSKGELVWLTGRGGAGKSTMAKQMSPEFDMVVGSDTGYVDPVQKKWIEPTPEEKLRIRSERARDILKAKSEGKRVLFEGAPGPASKYPSELLSGIDRIIALKVPKSVLKQNVITRSKERGSWNDPKAREDDMANFEALYNNYTDKLKEIRGLTRAPIEHRVPEYVSQQKDRKNKDEEIVMQNRPKLIEKMGQAALGGAAGKASRFLTHGIPLPGHMRGPGLMDVANFATPWYVGLPFGGGVDRYMQNAALESKILRGKQGGRATRQLAEAMGVRGRDAGKLMGSLRDTMPARPIAHTVGTIASGPTLRTVGGGVLGAGVGAKDSGVKPSEDMSPEDSRKLLKSMALGALVGGGGGLAQAHIQKRVHNRALAERLQQAVRTGNTNPLGAQELRLLKNLQAAKAKL